MVYTLLFFFSSKCSLFYNSNIFGSCIIHILYTGCAKFKKNNSGAKSLLLERKLIRLNVVVYKLLLFSCRCVGCVCMCTCAVGA